MTDSLFEQYKAALRRGHLAALAGNLDEALRAYRDAARLVPERSLPLASQGTVLHRLGRWDEATEAFDAALRLSPDDEAALRARASAREARGVQPGAAADFERLAFVLDVAGRAKEAADAARRAADLEPTQARSALAHRLSLAAAQAADLVPGGVAARPAAVPEGGSEGPRGSDDAEATAAGAIGDRPAEARDEAVFGAEGEDLEAAAAWAAVAERFAVERLDEDAPLALAPAETAAAETGAAADGAPSAADDARSAADGTGATVLYGDGPERAADAFPGLDQEPDAPPPLAEPATATAAAPDADGDEDRPDWPPVDLPSLPPPPLEGPAPDPEQLLALAMAAVEARDLDGARDMLLTAVIVHREAGRLDAALEVCLELLEIAPGDPQVHIAIANLQLDRGWTDLAKEKIDLLLRLTSLTGDTQAEADVHYLASERLRDDPVSPQAAR